MGELQSEIEHNYTSEEMFWIGKALRNMTYHMKHDKEKCIPLDVTNQLLRSAYMSILTSAKRLKNAKSKK